jgi:hypothetical protein
VFGGLFSTLAFVIRGDGFVGLAMLGIAIFATGASIFMYYGCISATKCIVALTKKIALGIKSLFVGKETA